MGTFKMSKIERLNKKVNSLKTQQSKIRDQYQKYIQSITDGIPVTASESLVPGQILLSKISSDIWQAEFVLADGKHIFSSSVELASAIRQLNWTTYRLGDYKNDYQKISDDISIAESKINAIVDSSKSNL